MYCVAWLAWQVVPMMSVEERLEFARKLAESPTKADEWLSARGYM
jgi:hypothetical protein